MFITTKKFRYMQRQIATLHAQLEGAKKTSENWEIEYNNESRKHEETRTALRQEQRDHQVTKAYLSAKETQCARLARENGKLSEDNALLNASLDAISKEKNPELLAIGFQSFIETAGKEAKAV